MREPTVLGREVLASSAGRGGSRSARALTWLLWGLAIVVLTWACQARRPAKPPNLPAPMESTSLGPGDIFQLEVVGEKDLPSEYQVASDGTVDFPYLSGIQVAGLEPQQVASVVREGLVNKQILTDPSVIVRVKEYRSKRITVLGQVNKPGSFPFQPGMTLVQAISLAGGPNSLAVTDRIRLTRRIKDEKSATVVVDLAAINSGEMEDILLQAGDRVFLDERVF